jgi:hypothetical protein
VELKKKIVVAVEFRQDRLCVQDLLIDNTGYGGTFLDANRTLIFNYFYDSELIPTLIKTIHTYRRIGKSVDCLVQELATYNALIELFVFILEDATCFGLEKFDEISEEFKFECIREHLKCEYGTGNVIDDLIDILRIRFGGDGIDFMTIEGEICTTFEIR